MIYGNGYCCARARADSCMPNVDGADDLDMLRMSTTKMSPHRKWNAIARPFFGFASALKRRVVCNIVSMVVNGTGSSVYIIIWSACVVCVCYFPHHQDAIMSINKHAGS